MTSDRRAAAQNVHTSVQDNTTMLPPASVVGNISPFTSAQQEKINTFQDFIMQAPSSFCAVCNRILYPEQEKLCYSTRRNWPCQEWHLEPITRPSGSGQLGVVVCSSHLSLRNSPSLIHYPSDIPNSVNQLNYREKSLLSPIKLMTQMTRTSTVCSGRIGHYEIEESIYT